MIKGLGFAVPEKLLTNSDLEKIVDTTDEWIKTRTGMEVRHIAEEGTNTSDLAAEAVQRALDDAGMEVEELDAIVVATVTGDMQFPSTACFVQDKLGAKGAAAFDIAAACSGFIYGLSVANGLIAAGQFRTIAVVGAEVLSRITDYEDRATCVLFGDGAGAAIVVPADGSGRGILDTYLKSDGSLYELLYMPGGGTRYPASHKTVDEKFHYIKMEGREVFKYAVTAMGEAAEYILQRNGLTGDDVSLLIPHQANSRIIEATAKRVKIPPERVFVNIHKYGNTSAASIPIALAEAKQEGRIREGDLVLLVAFGAGFTWGSALVRF
ncbi:MAG: ketoacyl-ACP synthase III [candidate division KSB1 bacterium]|nr:ketoacyl-ACP synthase III [candidate division KSB1 bacterium]